MLDIFMDVAQRAVFDLDARIASALRFARASGLPPKIGWHAGVALVREDPVVTEILMHYLIDSRALSEFDLGWEQHYYESRERADLLLSAHGGAEHHVIEVKWWWFPKDKWLVRKDAEKLRARRQRAKKRATGHVLIVTTAEKPGDWRDARGQPDASAVLDWFTKNDIQGIWKKKLGKIHVRVFPTNATLPKDGPTGAEYVGALILVPVANEVPVA